MQQSYEPMDIQLLDLNTTNIPQVKTYNLKKLS